MNFLFLCIYLVYLVLVDLYNIWKHNFYTCYNILKVNSCVLYYSFTPNSDTVIICCVYNLHFLFSSVDGHLEIFPFLILVNNAILTLLYKILFSFEHIPWSRIFGFRGLAYKRGRGKEREGRREDACICMHIDVHTLVPANTLSVMLSLLPFYCF